MSDESITQELVSIFNCAKDPDIEFFLQKRAMQFEKLGKSRTFLIYDEDDNESFKVLAYFTLALQVLKVPDKLSNRKIKTLDGFNAKINGERITEFPALLIGQLGKNDLYKDSVTGDEVMQFCLGKILEGQYRLGGRIIMLECKDIPYLINFYKKFGFQKIEKEYNDGELLQLIRIIEEDEIIDSD